MMYGWYSLDVRCVCIVYVCLYLHLCYFVCKCSIMLAGMHSCMHHATYRLSRQALNMVPGMHFEIFDIYIHRVGMHLGNA